MRLGRETAQEQDAGPFWQERLEWMLLCFHSPKIRFLPVILVILQENSEAFLYAFFSPFVNLT